MLLMIKSHEFYCPLLDWSWSDIANNVAGVVTDHGTRVSRGSEVSGIVQVAAVLGTRDATAKIKDGDFVKIIGALCMFHLIHKYCLKREARSLRKSHTLFSQLF